MTTDDTPQAGASDETGNEESPAVAAAQNLGSEISETFAKLGGGERLAVLGSAIVLAGWLVFDLLVDKYSTGQAPFALAVLVVGAAMAHHRRTSGKDPVPYTSVLFVGAGILGLIGATDAIEGLRNDIFDRGGTIIFGALVYYGGSIMALVGAWQLRGKTQ